MHKFENNNTILNNARTDLIIGRAYTFHTIVCITYRFLSVEWNLCMQNTTHNKHIDKYRHLNDSL